MVLRAVRLVVVALQVTHQPLIGLALGLRLVEVAQRLVRFLDGAEGALDLGRVDPLGLVDVLEVGRRQVELPAAGIIRPSRLGASICAQARVFRP